MTNYEKIHNELVYLASLSPEQLAYEPYAYEKCVGRGILDSEMLKHENLLRWLNTDPEEQFKTMEG